MLFYTRLYEKFPMVLIAEMNATRSVDNDSGVGHKNCASHCDFIYIYIKYSDFPENVQKTTPFH